MEQRQLAILAKTGEFTIAELSRGFEASRRTAHKWIERFELGGLKVPPTGRRVDPRI
jgi:transposase